MGLLLLSHGVNYVSFFVRPLERGGKGWSVVRAVARRTLTPEELDSCWYCQHCGEAIQ